MVRELVKCDKVRCGCAADPRRRHGPYTYFRWERCDNAQDASSTTASTSLGSGLVRVRRWIRPLETSISRKKHGVGSISGANTGEPYAGNFVALPRNLFPKNFGAPGLASKFPSGSDVRIYFRIPWPL